jgi:tetratricopeptide (TPR) repeat protein
MPKDAPGRNDPCPCGSGKKYKKCCLSRDEEAAPKVVEADGHAACSEEDHVRAGVIHVPADLSPAEAREYVERLDRWCNSAHDALEDGRFEEAESLADRVRAEYPDLIDGYELRARVRLQQKRWAEAVEDFEQAIAVALRHRDDYDEELIQELRDDVEHARAHAQDRDWNPDAPPAAPHAHRQGS